MMLWGYRKMTANAANHLFSALILLQALLSTALATTEWFGDLRAHLNPPRSPAFYDVVYDDSDCPMGLQSNAVPEFVYFGEMVATKSVKEHSTCLQMCLATSRCKAVNFFEPLTKKEKGFCELLSESQYDNPRLMRPFKKAIYYEKIRCRAADDDQEDIIGDETTTRAHRIGEKGRRPNKKNMAVSLPAPSVLPTPSAEDIIQASVSPPQSSEIQTGNEKNNQGETTEARETTTDQTSTPKAPRKQESMTILKKLAAKIHEFNLRFRSR